MTAGAQARGLAGMKAWVLAAGAAMAVLLAGCGSPKTALTPPQMCFVGAYRLADGRTLDIAPSEGADMRWRLLDGRTGRPLRRAGSKRSSRWLNHDWKVASRT